jgi:hypothetical protein
MADTQRLGLRTVLAVIGGTGRLAGPPHSQQLFATRFLQPGSGACAPACADLFIAPHPPMHGATERSVQTVGRVNDDSLRLCSRCVLHVVTGFVHERQGVSRHLGGVHLPRTEA